jgi:hypothetical protein
VSVSVAALPFDAVVFLKVSVLAPMMPPKINVPVAPAAPTRPPPPVMAPAAGAPLRAVVFGNFV